MNNHWIGHSPIKPIDVDELFNRRIIITGPEDSLNDDNAIDASVVAELVLEDASGTTQRTTILPK